MSEAAKTNGDDRNLRSAASSSAAGKKIIIKSADMKDDLQTVAINIAIDAFEKHSVEKDVAEYIKKEFDKKHGPTWHCIVGKNFGICFSLLYYSTLRSFESERMLGFSSNDADK